MKSLTLIFATNNSNKCTEIQAIVGHSFFIKSLAEIGCTDDIIENGKTIKENASIKSHFIYNKYKLNCFADDTGLIVESLNGEPGVKSARYAGEQKNNNDNIQLLLQNLAPKQNKNAYFHTVISLINNGIEYIFEGKLEGEIIQEKRGYNGFGYDPIFIPNGFSKTLAEISMGEKNTISHRAIAFNKLKDYLLQLSF